MGKTIAFSGQRVLKPRTPELSVHCWQLEWRGAGRQCQHQSNRRGVFRTNICLSSSPNPSLHFTYKKTEAERGQFSPVQQYRASCRGKSGTWTQSLSPLPPPWPSFHPSLSPSYFIYLKSFFFLEVPTIPDHPDTLLNEAASKVFY